MFPAAYIPINMVYSMKVNPTTLPILLLGVVTMIKPQFPKQLQAEMVPTEPLLEDQDTAQFMSIETDRNGKDMPALNFRTI